MAHDVSGRRHPARAALAALVALATALPAAAGLPLANATKDDMVNRLSAPAEAAPAGGPVSRGLNSGGPETRGFRPAEAARPGGSTLGSTLKPAGDFRCTGPGARNLEVVYADDTAAQVDMALQFTVGSHQLLPASQQLLDTLAQALADPKLADERFVVAGHTDVTGAQDMNLRLSCARAVSAMNYLVQVKGVDPARLVAYGFGPNRLLAGQAPDSPAHRRVEIRKAPR